MRARLDPRSNAPIAVAFSGGPDSYEALRWTLATGRPVIALHVDHGLNPASGDWAATAHRLAQDLGAQFRCLRWEGAKPAAGVAAAARAARHRLIAEAARAAGAQVIVTGHTGDDRLENAAMGLGRVAEWAPSPAWPEGRGLFLLRPLLRERRAAIRRRLADEGLLARLIDDPANQNETSPRIAARRGIAGLSDLPASAREDDDIASLARCADLTGGAIRIRRDIFDKASEYSRRKALGAALVCAGGGDRIPRAERVSRLIGALQEQASLTATLCGAKLTASPQEILIVRDAGEIARGRVSPLVLRAHETGVFDGRFAVTAADEALEIHPLRGHAAALPAAQKRALKAVHAAVRPCLPVTLGAAGPTSPFLARPPSPGLAALAGARFRAACGVFAHEGDL